MREQACLLVGASMLARAWGPGSRWRFDLALALFQMDNLLLQELGVLAGFLLMPVSVLCNMVWARLFTATGCGVAPAECVHVSAKATRHILVASVWRLVWLAIAAARAIQCQL
jgi:hypothetical protein